MSDSLEISVDEWILEDETNSETNDNDAELDVKKYQKMLSLNNQIMSQLMNLKAEITLALQKCEWKLTRVEKSLQKQTVGERKALICTAGIPYFKDRYYFFAPKNEDEILKESRNELQMVNLPKTLDWSRVDKGILVNAVKAQEEKQGRESLAQATSIEKIKRARLDGPPREKPLDWMMISSLVYEQPRSPLDCRVIWNVFLRHGVNKSRWTAKEDMKLKAIAKACRFQDWEEISIRLGTQRTAYQCFIRYNTTKKLKAQNYNWSSKEDERLLKLVEIYRIGDFIPWGELTNWMPNRTKQQVYYRWMYSLAPYLSKGRFTKAEDKILMDGVAKYGKNFHKISTVLMPHRSTVQLHYRHETLCLNEIEDWNRWTLAEDVRLLELFRDKGTDWSAIAKQFPRKKSRTQLRHRYAALQKYIKRGVSLLDLHCNEINQEKETGSNLAFTVLNNKSCNDKDTVKRDNKRDGDDNDNWIDLQLIEYFRSKLRKEKVSNKKIFKHDVTDLYDALRQLDTVLFIPDEGIDKKLSGENRWLAFALKDYVRRKRDAEKQTAQIVDEYRLRMFACSKDEGTPEEASTRFIPPLPFDMQYQKSKYPSVTPTIDYGLNGINNYLLDIPSVFETPDHVTAYIDKENKELEKLLALYETEDNSKSNVTRSSLNSNKRISAWIIEKKPVQDDVERDASDGLLFQDANAYNPRISFTYYCTGSTRDARVIDATHATLSCFRALTRLKRLSEKYNLNNIFLVRLNEFYKPFRVLETRLEQLFKYPIGMSRIGLVENVSNSCSFADIDAEDKSISSVNTRKRRLQQKI